MRHNYIFLLFYIVIKVNFIKIVKLHGLYSELTNSQPRITVHRLDYFSSLQKKH